jgi:hypothetical protein
LKESGFSVRHSRAIIRKGSSAIAIAGAGDFYEDTAGLDTALKNIPVPMFRIVLAHNPDTADLPRRERVDLFLCGHTHGGQVRVPLIDRAIILPVENRDYDAGIKTTARNERIFISRGIGWAIMPVRFNCVPEIAIITLLKE